MTVKLAHKQHDKDTTTWLGVVHITSRMTRMRKLISGRLTLKLEVKTLYHPQTKFPEGNAFTLVCHSVHRGEEVSPLGLTSRDGHLSDPRLG